MKTMEVPIAIGLLGTISKNFHNHAQRLELDTLKLVRLTEICTFRHGTHFKKNSSALRNWVES